VHIILTALAGLSLLLEKKKTKNKNKVRNMVGRSVLLPRWETGNIRA
jgi:hypothetical protein